MGMKEMENELMENEPEGYSYLWLASGSHLVTPPNVFIPDSPDSPILTPKRRQINSEKEGTSFRLAKAECIRARLASPHFFVSAEARGKRTTHLFLRYSDELEEMAQAWAEKLARQAHISYSELSGVGENITFFPSDVDADSVVEHWYVEHEKVRVRNPGMAIGIGRAVVGASDSDGDSSLENSTPDSRKLAADGDQVVVAFYRPSGNNNRAGQFAVNVLKPSCPTKSHF
ncbi:unnamed protein product [Caenorhabditis auriculariae]|uniref:SCP domain-containing protein n=1 Tax=Caenorhabditis auriculariae TaxID=2777116 RepID=A0A8S1H0C5_9PELO|nr:unnamed protein product [Caenorhabditis auriculariae]